MTTSLELGCDCLGEIRYLDAALHNSKGEPYTITNAICIHEEDNAVLWKHVDADAGAGPSDAPSDRVVPRDSRQLRVPDLLAVLQDGNIECEVRATGMMVTTAIGEGGGASAWHVGRQPHVRALSSAFSDRAAGSEHRRHQNTVYMSETEECRRGRRTRTDCRWGNGMRH